MTAESRWTALPPAAGSAVMATGILSVGLHLTGHEGVSRVALALTAAAWLTLAGLFAYRLLRTPARWVAEADTPPALTAVAASTVLGTRLALLGGGARPVAVALLVVAALLWPVLLTAVVRHWGRRMPGAVFLVCVATQGLVVLAGTLAATLPAAWLAWPAVVIFALGLVLYGAAFSRFDLGNVRTGAGDQWVAGGALAISALAGAKLLALPQWHDAPVLRAVTLALLALDLAWYAVLLLAELRYPRPRYDVRRWATVFPMGMTAVAALSVSAAAGVDWAATVGRVLLWPAVAAWLLTCAGAVRQRVTSGRG
ncbi:hypothetical protein G5C51_39660 [Streptomyces sp. A7024]|uniref:Integral membrane protein n=2 Tax=Streptomyces coryli TaxID=1128680 RepID=A0A6G4UDA4_9ACTN|nr:tellurite resistance/C4-dicarboxylate transporter family protein [Streptomyces coryli]NGN69992.1 hypothetical protein [Streptomyces coryli]